MRGPQTNVILGFILVGTPGPSRSLDIPPACYAPVGSFNMPIETIQILRNALEGEWVYVQALCGVTTGEGVLNSVT